MTVDPIVAPVFSVAVGLLFAIIGWTMNRLFQRIDKLEEDHTRAEVDLVKYFVTNAHLQELKVDLIARLTRVDESIQHLTKRLERKAQRGEKGETGETGEAGEQGPPGKYLWVEKGGADKQAFTGDL